MSGPCPFSPASSPSSSSHSPALPPRPRPGPRRSPPSFSPSSASRAPSTASLCRFRLQRRGARCLPAARAGRASLRSFGRRPACRKELPARSRCPRPRSWPGLDGRGQGAGGRGPPPVRRRPADSQAVETRGHRRRADLRSGGASSRPPRATATEPPKRSGTPSGCAKGVGSGGFTRNQYLEAYGIKALHRAGLSGRGMRMIAAAPTIPPPRRG